MRDRTTNGSCDAATIDSGWLTATDGSIALLLFRARRWDRPRSLPSLGKVSAMGFTGSRAMGEGRVDRRPGLTFRSRRRGTSRWSGRARPGSCSWKTPNVFAVRAHHVLVEVPHDPARLGAHLEEVEHRAGARAIHLGLGHDDPVEASTLCERLDGGVRTALLRAELVARVAQPLREFIAEAFELLELFVVAARLSSCARDVAHEHNLAAMLGEVVRLAVDVELVAKVVQRLSLRLREPLKSAAKMPDIIAGSRASMTV